jgi:hypothetical protein
MTRLTGNYLLDLLRTPGLTKAQQREIVLRFLRNAASEGQSVRLPAEAVAVFGDEQLTLAPDAE